jgi:hypothetical protein
MCTILALNGGTSKYINVEKENNSSRLHISMAWGLYQHLPVLHPSLNQFWAGI